MPYYPLEAFCSVEYPSELSYEELLAHEAELIPHVESLFADYNAVHVDVFPDGDELKIQCAFSELSPAEFQSLARQLARGIPACATGRMLLVQKNLRGATLVQIAMSRARIYELPLG